MQTPLNPSDSPLITIAVLAMGGEGGGVLADWLVDLAQNNGYLAQSTSVPGVAQRTGATIYYIEMFPRSSVPDGKLPVMALSPFPGAVDIVIASELMEAGRAVQRGFVDAQKTTFIASTHRVYSMTERVAMGDGRVDQGKLIEGAQASAKLWLGANFSAVAEQAGSLIGPALFGALALIGRLPFDRQQFEDSIKRSGVGVQSSLKAFAAGWQEAKATQARGSKGNLHLEGQATPGLSAPPALAPVGPRLQALALRAAHSLPAPALENTRLGLMRLADYQSIDYAALFLDRLISMSKALENLGPQAAPLISETARHLALWMTYEDSVRVADLKTRRARFDRVGREVRQTADQGLAINEFLHPRVEEIADILPAPVGRWLLSSRWARACLAPLTRKGRIVQTSSLRGFALLYAIASLRRWRPVSLRYTQEHERMQQWLAQAVQLAYQQPELAMQVVKAQQLIKGYGDTHARGWRSFEKIIQALPLLQSQVDGSKRMAHLIQAALADEHGNALDKALFALNLHAQNPN
jgi:indolepyruvate ferredoxin oxidoreductase beta subunit